MAKRKRVNPGGPERKPKRKPKRKRKPAPQPKPGGAGKPVSEKLKETSSQSGPDAMAATPTTMPTSAAPDASPAIYSTGPGEVVVYGYDRQGQGEEDYQLQQSAYTAPVPSTAGVGQVFTPGAAGGQ